MAVYTIVVKRGNMEYSLSGDDKAFVSAHIHEVFSELKTREQNDYNSLLPNIDFEKEQVFAQEVSPKKTELAQEPVVPNAANPDAMAALEILFEPKRKESVNAEAQLPSTEVNVIREIPQVEVKEAFFENVFVPKRDLSNEVFEQPKPVEEASSGMDFENILEQKMSNTSVSDSAVYEDAPPVIEDYATFVKNKSPESMTDYLVITAYYMLENERIPKFAIKQLNQKLFSSMKLLVDNKTAQNALERGFIEIVSDFSENGITEYALTAQGRNYYINGFK